MTNKLRLLVTKACNRSCPGCCNKEWDLDGLETWEGEMDYDEIILTGGEPLMFPELLDNLIGTVRDLSDAKILVYTAHMTQIPLFRRILEQVDGITLTLHDPADLDDFLWLHADLMRNPIPGKSLRLNVFHPIAIPNYVPLNMWQVKYTEWHTNCPLPEGEVFKKLDTKAWLDK